MFLGVYLFAIAYVRAIAFLFRAVQGALGLSGSRARVSIELLYQLLGVIQVLLDDWLTLLGYLR